MKQILRQISLLAAFLMLTACGSKVQPTQLADQILAKYVDMAEALSSVKDAESAGEAAVEITKIGDDLLQIAEQAEDLDEVTAELRQRNRAEYIKVMDRLLYAKDQLGRRVADDREAMQILVAAMEEFEAKESSMEPLFALLGLRVD
ncbi:hypothetical protein SAMN02745181_3116 [Rubritalea squalenifaciens DSM 18772]|uniref:Uncharacterized protein n=1 Tax=Rubritalea squalenifaciens DSM 18772 TaxID=1123071 RepID=A0A1M6P9N3_9BACT|nr:hypothetical protein [Rubritalea squalenifaciens]SHK04600.1 hypothetical protein SAMN02745181_3116 [Rubritalea squalenifaciens DSM 18772]